MLFWEKQCLGGGTERTLGVGTDMVTSLREAHDG